MKKQTQSYNTLGVRKHKDGQGFSIQARKAYGYTGAACILIGIGAAVVTRPLAKYAWAKAQPGIAAAMNKLRTIFRSSREEKSN